MTLSYRRRLWPAWRLVPLPWLVANGPALAAPEEVAVTLTPLGTLLRLAVALAIVLLAFLVCARLMRRFDLAGRGATQAGLRIVGALSLGHRERLVIVQAGEEQLLLGVCAGRIERLHLLEHPLDGASRDPLSRASAPTVAGGDFRARLLAAMRRGVPS